MEKSLSRRDSISKKAAKLMNRAKSMENRIEKNISEKNKLLQNTEKISSLKISPLKYPQKILVRADKLSAFYDGIEVFSNVSFQINQGDRIAVTGRNGCGKSTLLKLICGEDIENTGILKIGSGLKISYASQDTSNLNGNLSDYAEKFNVDESLFKAILRKLDFSRELFQRPIESYSQGQKKKVALARSLSEKANLYIWDEPLNYIDVLSRIQIEELLKSSEASILFVEHDKRFCEQTATKYILL